MLITPSRAWSSPRLAVILHVTRREHINLVTIAKQRVVSLDSKPAKFLLDCWPGLLASVAGVSSDAGLPASSPAPSYPISVSLPDKEIAGASRSGTGAHKTSTAGPASRQPKKAVAAARAKPAKTPKKAATNAAKPAKKRAVKKVTTSKGGAKKKVTKRGAKPPRVAKKVTASKGDAKKKVTKRGAKPPIRR